MSRRTNQAADITEIPSSQTTESLNFFGKEESWHHFFRKTAHQATRLLQSGACYFDVISHIAKQRHHYAMRMKKPSSHYKDYGVPTTTGITTTFDTLRPILRWDRAVTSMPQLFEALMLVDDNDPMNIKLDGSRRTPLDIPIDSSCKARFSVKNKYCRQLKMEEVCGDLTLKTHISREWQQRVSNATSNIILYKVHNPDRPFETLKQQLNDINLFDDLGNTDQKWLWATYLLVKLCPFISGNKAIAEIFFKAYADTIKPDLRLSPDWDWASLLGTYQDFQFHLEVFNSHGALTEPALFRAVQRTTGEQGIRFFAAQRPAHRRIGTQLFQRKIEHRSDKESIEPEEINPPTP